MCFAVRGCGDAFDYKVGQAARELVGVFDLYTDDFIGRGGADGVVFAVDLNGVYNCTVGVHDMDINIDVLTLGNGGGITLFCADGLEVYLGQNRCADCFLNNTVAIAQIVLITEHDGVRGVGEQLIKGCSIERFAACDQLAVQINAQISDLTYLIGVGYGCDNGEEVVRLVLLLDLICRNRLGLGIDVQLGRGFQRALTVVEIVGEVRLQHVCRVGQKSFYVTCIQRNLNNLAGFDAKQLHACQGSNAVGVSQGQIECKCFLLDRLIKQCQGGHRLCLRANGDRNMRLMYAAAIIEVVNVGCLHRVRCIGEQTGCGGSIQGQLNCAGFIADQLQTSHSRNDIGVVNVDVKGELFLTYRACRKGYAGYRLCLRAHLQFGYQFVCSVTVVEIINISCANGILRIGEQIACNGRIQRQLNRACLITDQFQASQRCNAIGVIQGQCKAQLGLRRGYVVQRCARYSLRQSGECDRNTFNVCTVGIRSGQGILVFRKQIGNRGRVRIQAEGTMRRVLKHQRGYCFLGRIVSPKQRIIYCLLTNCHVIKQQNRSGIECFGLQHVDVIAGAIQCIVVCNNGILIQCIGFQAGERDLVLLAHGDRFHVTYFVAVVQNCYHGAFAVRNQRKRVVHGYVEGNIVEVYHFI